MQIAEELQKSELVNRVNSSKTKISIVLPTNKSFNSIRSVFETLKNQKDIDVNDIELIVVDNSEHGILRNDISEITKQFSWPVHYFHEPRAGVPFALNAGIINSENPIVTFLADDMILETNYLQSLQKEFANRPHVSVLTSRVKLPEGFVWDLATNDYENEREFRYPCNPGAAGPGNAMHVKREVFQKVGLFDELFAGKGAAGEDTELCYRILKAGYTIYYSPRVVSYHYHRRNSEKDYMESVKVYNKGNGRFFAKYIFRDQHIARLFVWTWVWVIKTIFGIENKSNKNISKSILRKKAFAAAAGMFLGVIQYPFCLISLNTRKNK